MPKITSFNEVRFFEPGDVPDGAKVLEIDVAARWRAYHMSKLQHGQGRGYRPGWFDQYGPSDERTVAALVSWSGGELGETDIVRCACGRQQRICPADEPGGITELEAQMLGWTRGDDAGWSCPFCAGKTKRLRQLFDGEDAN